MTITVRKPLDLEAAKMASTLASMTFEKPSRTKQQFAEESDINTIVNRFLQTGTLPDVNVTASFGDFIDAPDSFQEAMNLVIEAQDAFNALPSDVRKRFQNDPQELLTFLQDENNKDEAIRLGLIDRPAESLLEAPRAEKVPPSSEGEGTA